MAGSGRVPAYQGPYSMFIKIPRYKQIVPVSVRHIFRKWHSVSISTVTRYAHQGPRVPILMPVMGINVYPGYQVVLTDMFLSNCWGTQKPQHREIVSCLLSFFFLKVLAFLSYCMTN